MAAVGTDVVVLALALPEPQVEQTADQYEQQHLHAWGQDVPGAGSGRWLGRLLLEFDGGLGHRMGCWLWALGCGL